MGKKMLKVISVSADIFDRLMKDFNKYVVVCNSLNEYKTGYPDKETFRVNINSNQMICQSQFLNWECGELVIPAADSWKQVILMRQADLEPGQWYFDISGQQARKEIEKRILKHYTETEYKEILLTHCEEKQAAPTQIHYCETEAGDNVLRKSENVWAYDINNAHGSGLMELFPRCSDIWNDMYEHRKDNNGKYKKYFNYFWGTLGKKNSPYRGAYWWVVHRTSRLVKDFWLSVGGRPVYMNTDGIYLQNPTNPVESSDKLGEFKGKHGTTYTYRCNQPGYTPYWLVQFVGDDGTVETKSDIPIYLRGGIDLAKGKTIRYTKMKVANHYEYQNVEEINV